MDYSSVERSHVSKKSDNWLIFLLRNKPKMEWTTHRVDKCIPACTEVLFLSQSWELKGDRGVIDIQCIHMWQLSAWNQSKYIQLLYIYALVFKTRFLPMQYKLSMLGHVLHTLGWNKRGFLPINFIKYIEIVTQIVDCADEKKSRLRDVCLCVWHGAALFPSSGAWVAECPAQCYYYTLFYRLQQLGCRCCLQRLSCGVAGSETQQDLRFSGRNSETAFFPRLAALGSHCVCFFRAQRRTPTLPFLTLLSLATALVFKWGTRERPTVERLVLGQPPEGGF